MHEARSTELHILQSANHTSELGIEGGLHRLSRFQYEEDGGTWLIMEVSRM